MLFPTVDFAVFFVVVLAGSWLLRPNRRLWRWFIFFSSCWFYLDPLNPRHTLFNPAASAMLAATAIATTCLVRIGFGAPEVTNLEGSAGETLARGERGATSTGRAGARPSTSARRTTHPAAFAIPYGICAAIVLGNAKLGDWYPEAADQNWRFLFVLLGIVFVNAALARATFAALGPSRARTRTSAWIVRSAVAINLCVLGYFKYTNFFLDFFLARLENLGLAVSRPVLTIVLPIAVSFFVFQAISYVVDVGRGTQAPVPQLDFAVYLTFFAHLVAGPIVRVSEFVPQLDAVADPRRVRSAEAFMLIVRGMVKKVVVSSYLAATVVDPVFALPGSHTRTEVALGILGYAIQIYADFSGYTDIAIGVALLVGIRLPQNFDAPYRALSFQDFWRRWHMTLSRWLRDYLYIPLGGNRGTPLRTYVNLVLTMLLGGLWHGANGTFIIWGGIHGGALATERRARQARAEREPIRSPPAAAPILKWFLTFGVVCLAWVFFRAPSVGDAFAVLGALVGGGDGTQSIPTGSLVLAASLVAVSIASQFVPPAVPERASERFAQLQPVIQGLVLGLGLVAVDALGPEGVAPFIYFQF